MMAVRKRIAGIGRRAVIGSACVVATAAFARPQRTVSVDQLTVFDLPLVLDLVEIGDHVSLVPSAHGQYVHWKGRILGRLPTEGAASIGPAARRAQIVRCARLAERSYQLEISLVG